MIESNPILKPQSIPIERAIKSERMRLSDNLDRPQHSALLAQLIEQQQQGATCFYVVPF
jgi:hypothetical protein